MRGRITSIFSLFFLMFPLGVFGQEVSPEPISESDLTQTSGSSFPEFSSLWHQVEWGFTLNGVLQGNPSTDIYADQTDATVSGQLEFSVPVSEHGEFFTLIEAGYGEGIDARIPTFSGFNDDADPEERLYFSEAWYEHKWERLRFRIGQVDLTTDFDTNEYANCENEQFISTGFVNNLALEIPDNTFGGFLWWDLGERFSLGGGYQSNNGWEDVFRSGFGIVEADFRPHFLGKPGNYRFYGWVSRHDAFDESFLLEDPLYGGCLRWETEHFHAYTNAGWGFSFDQELGERMGVWCRYGSQKNDDFNAFKSSFSAGIHFHKFLPRRESDEIGIAYGLIRLGDAYRTSLEADGLMADSEHHLEVYYRIALGDCFQLSPNIQWVKNPCGDATKDDIVVFGLHALIARSCPRHHHYHHHHHE